jgi:hypothetical protein
MISDFDVYDTSVVNCKDILFLIKVAVLVYGISLSVSMLISIARFLGWKGPTNLRDVELSSL